MKDLHFSRSFIKFWKSNVCVGKIQTYAEGDSGVTKQMKKAVSADSNTDKAKKINTIIWSVNGNGSILSWLPWQGFGELLLICSGEMSFAMRRREM